MRRGFPHIRGDAPYHTIGIGTLEGMLRARAAFAHILSRSPTPEGIHQSGPATKIAALGFPHTRRNPDMSEELKIILVVMMIASSPGMIFRWYVLHSQLRKGKTTSRPKP